ncbi:MAG TPA: hypothetical protein VH814_17640 [Steroidobacteraceae bacterium]|jgi:hypothetical protein
MCPICLTTATVVAASTTSGAGVIGLLAAKFHVIRSWFTAKRHD